MTTAPSANSPAKIPANVKRVTRRKRLGLAAVATALAAGAGYQFVLREPETTGPREGEVLVLERINVNLAGGHYLRMGLALQLTDQAAEVDGSRALDEAISLFSGRALDELSGARQREKLRDKLAASLTSGYDGDVMAVYFTEFVTQ